MKTAQKSDCSAAVEDSDQVCLYGLESICGTFRCRPNELWMMLHGAWMLRPEDNVLCSQAAHDAWEEIKFLIDFYFNQSITATPPEAP